MRVKPIWKIFRIFFGAISSPRWVVEIIRNVGLALFVWRNEQDANPSVGAGGNGCSLRHNTYGMGDLENEFL